MRFEPLDLVRIQELAVPRRDVDGPGAEPPQPRVGEVAVVVDSLGDDLYLIEHVTDDGHSVWMAEFQARELRLVERRSDG